MNAPAVGADPDPGRPTSTVWFPVVDCAICALPADHVDVHGHVHHTDRRKRPCQLPPQETAR